MYVGERGWADRSVHWLGATYPSRSGRTRSKSAALILSGVGARLAVEKSVLIVRNGLTHFPQERETWRFFHGDAALPSRIVILDGVGSLSFDVLRWLASQRVGLFLIDYRGRIVSAVAACGVNAFDQECVSWQLDTRAAHDRRIRFCRDLVSDKIAESLTTLRTCLPPTSARERAIHTAEHTIRRLATSPPADVQGVMLSEARAAASYFAAWRGLPIRWKSRARYPIPPAWERADARRAYGPRRTRTNRHATHPINAMLNYAYAALHSDVQMRAVSDGYDPTLGIMHETGPDRSALVLDLMEPRRPVVDAALLRFVGANTFSGADFTLTDEGVCRLNPQLARRVAALV